MLDKVKKDNNLFPVAAIFRKYSISVSSLYAWIKRGAVNFKQVENCYYIYDDEKLDKYLKTKKTYNCLYSEGEYMSFTAYSVKSHISENCIKQWIVKGYLDTVIIDGKTKIKNTEKNRHIARMNLKRIAAGRTKLKDADLKLFTRQQNG